MADFFLRLAGSTLQELPTAPSNVSTSEIENRELILTWENNSIIGDNNLVQQWNPVTLKWETLYTLALSATTHNVEDLAPNTAYKLRVAIKLGTDYFPAPTTEFTTTDKNEPIPYNITVTGETYNGVTVNWQNEVVAGMGEWNKVMIVNTSMITVVEANVDLSATTYTFVSGLTPNQQYHAVVCTRDWVEEPAPAHEYFYCPSIYPTFNTVNIAPTNLVASDIVDTGMTLTWENNDSTVEGMNKYAWYLDMTEFGTASQEVIPFSSTTYQLTGLTPEHQYHIKIYINDEPTQWATGLAYSNEIEETTPATPKSGDLDLAFNANIGDGSLGDYIFSVAETADSGYVLGAYHCALWGDDAQQPANTIVFLNEDGTYNPVTSGITISEYDVTIGRIETDATAVYFAGINIGTIQGVDVGNDGVIVKMLQSDQSVTAHYDAQPSNNSGMQLHGSRLYVIQEGIGLFALHTSDLTVDTGYTLNSSCSGNAPRGQSFSVDSSGNVFCVEAADSEIKKYDNTGAEITGFTSPANMFGGGQIMAIQVSADDNYLYVGGSFTENGNHEKLFRVSTATGEVDETWNTMNYISGEIQSITMDGDKPLVGQVYSYDGVSNIYYYTRLDNNEAIRDTTWNDLVGVSQYGAQNIIDSSGRFLQVGDWYDGSHVTGCGILRKINLA